MTGWDLVIFDNDGVLVDSEPIANRVLADLLTGYDVPTTPSEAIDRYVGLSIGSVRQRVEAATGQALPARFEDEYHRRLFARFPDELEPVAGAADAVHELERVDQPFCIASSGSPERIRLALTITGLLPSFTGRIFSGEDVAHGKPAPDLFLLAAARLGADPGRCVVVEDSAPGLAAARRAGMASVAYAPPEGPPLDVSDATAVVRHMAELPVTLRALARPA